jgi:lipoate-protein ligase B
MIHRSSASLLKLRKLLSSLSNLTSLLEQVCINTASSTEIRINERRDKRDMRTVTKETRKKGQVYVENEIAGASVAGGTIHE